MCRFAAYMGEPLLLAEVLYKPSNSLIHQSVYAKETTEHLNGDGFGVGWYSPAISVEPTLFTSMQPAWSNRNLAYLASCVKTNSFFAHVRAASSGAITDYNCHPFHYERFLFMHNGEIGGFDVIKRHIRHELRDEVYSWIKGQTDSEHFAALFIEMFKRKHAAYTVEGLANTLIMTIKKLEQIQKDYNVTEANYLTFAIADGKHMVLSRYVNDKELKPTTLHYCTAQNFEVKDGEGHMLKKDGKVGAVLVASEKLNAHRAEWHDVPENHLILIDEDLSCQLKDIQEMKDKLNSSLI